MGHRHRPDSWQELCRNASMETDPVLRVIKIEEARLATLARLQQLSNRPAHRKEREAMHEAFQLLNRLTETPAPSAECCPSTSESHQR